MFLNSISLDFCKKPRNIHFDLNSVFLLSIKLALPSYGPFSWIASQIHLLGELKFLFYFSGTLEIAYGIKIIILMTYAIAGMRSKKNSYQVAPCTPVIPLPPPGTW